MDKNVPCYGCDKRRCEKGYNCHSDCPEYKAYSQARVDRSKMICKKRAEEAMVVEVLVKAAEKTTREKIHRKREF